jgi:hypothetical protein
MEKDLIKFMGKINVINKDFSQYLDEEKGIEFLFNTINAVANVDYLELDKQQYEVAKFQNKIEDLEYEIETIKKAVPKNEITGKDEDKFTITEKDVAVRKVWNVSNRLGAYNSFTNKQSALECADNINKLIFDVILK